MLQFSASLRVRLESEGGSILVESCLKTRQDPVAIANTLKLRLRGALPLVSDDRRCIGLVVLERPTPEGPLALDLYMLSRMTVLLKTKRRPKNTRYIVPKEREKTYTI